MALVLMLSMLTLIAGCGKDGIVGQWDMVEIYVDGMTSDEYIEKAEREHIYGVESEMESFLSMEWQFKSNGDLIWTFDGVDSRYEFKYEIEDDNLTIDMVGYSNRTMEMTYELDGDELILYLVEDDGEVWKHVLERK